MTIKECIDNVDNIKPNEYGVEQKVQWLSFIDETIINDVLKTHEGYDGRYDTFSGYSEDKLSVSLVVPSPYDRLYPAYLKMKIDGENGETARYNNSASTFNSYLMEFRKYYNKTHMPLSIADKRDVPKSKPSIGVSEAEYENLKRELYALLSEDFAEATSPDKLYNIVNSYVMNNMEMLKGRDGIDGINGKDGYTPIKGIDYFDGKQGEPFTYNDFTQAQLDSLKGEKGDKGDKGDQGARGIQGVQGEKGDKGADGKDAVTDQTYSPTSKNAQSGMAVSQALKTLKTAEGTVVSQNADFAEVAEWADGNPNNEDRTGYFVCANVPVDGIVMRKATSIDDVKGVSILAPAFAGNYTKDKVDSNGNLLPKYSYVAIIGFVPVIDNGTCVVGGRCMPDDNGCAIPSSNSMGYQVVNRIDENRVLIIIEPNGDMVQRIKTKINKVQEGITNLASAIKNTLRGEVLTASDVSPIEHNLKVNVESKNLMKYPYSETTETVNGVLFTDNGDGTITATGKTNAGSSYFRFRSRSDKLKLKAGKYFFKALTTTGSITTLYGYLETTTISNIVKEHIDYGKGVAFTLEEDAEATISAMVMPQHDGTPLVFKPMLVKGTTETDWTPYISDVNGVKVSRCGKNIIPINKVDFPFSGYKTVWEGKITGNFVLSWKHNLTNITNTTSGLLRWHFADGTTDVSNAVGHNILYKKISGTITKIEVLNWCEAKGGSVYDIQLEVGTAQTDFEPFIEPQTAAADENGIVEGLTSVSPNMTLLTDTSGAVINLEYNADTKMYIDNKFAELSAAILNS